MNWVCIRADLPTADSGPGTQKYSYGSLSFATTRKAGSMPETTAKLGVRMQASSAEVERYTVDTVFQL